MVLHAEDRQALVPQALERLIVEVDVAQLDVGWKSGGIDREAMILGGDLDLAGRLVADRVVGAAVAELELEGLAAEGLAENLVPEADAEDRESLATRRRCESRSAAPGLLRTSAPGSPGPFDRKMPSG